MDKRKVLEFCGENFWGNRVYKLKDEEKYYADLGNEEQKFILAKMIAANEYKEGKTSVEWIDLASGIKNLELTKALLEELKREPMELIFDSGIGWRGKDQMEAMLVLKKYELDSNDNKFCYQMLGRLRNDCEYYLGFWGRSTNCLWAKNEKDQINIMKALYKSFYEWEKPEWLTMKQIKGYEMQMLNTKMDA